MLMAKTATKNSNWLKQKHLLNDLAKIRIKTVKYFFF